MTSTTQPQEDPTSTDLTGTHYWERFWTHTEVHVGPSRGSVRDPVREALLATIRHWVGTGTRWVEVGCANSHLLYDFPTRLGARLDGVDVAEEALGATERAVRAHGIDATFNLHDFREVPANMVGNYDGVVSCGFVEHFGDCTGVHSNLMRYVRPGGRVLTLIPNMSGITGMLQLLLDEETFLTHHVITPPLLRESMEAAGLTVDVCEPFIGLNLGVVNAGHLSPAVRRLVEFALVGGSRAVSAIENACRRDLRPRLWRSPYILAVGRL